MMDCKFVSALALFGILAAGRANAEILSLDCSDSAGVYDRIWVDTDRSTITQTIVRSESGFTGSVVTFPAQITATAITWTTQSVGGPAWFNVSIDRTSGILTQTGAGVATGYSTRQCAKGSAPFPATKF